MFKKFNIIVFIVFIGVLLSISATPAIHTVEINNVVQFEKETEYIGLTQKANLDAACALFKKYKNNTVIIIAHYNNDYGIERMDSLSAYKRAAETRQYLLDNGVENPIRIYVDMDHKFTPETSHNRIVTFKWLSQFR